MIEWEFILHADAEELEIDEPIGWSDIVLDIVRDRKYHGISIVYSANEIKLVGAGAELLKAKYLADGVDADVQIEIRAICDEEVQETETFKLDFGRYKEECNDSCRVSIGIEQISCFTDFNNNFEKKVDLLSSLAFDKVTALTDYAGLREEKTIPAKAILAQDEARTDPHITEELTNQISWSSLNPEGSIAPAFQNTVWSALGDFRPNVFPEWHSIGGENFPPYDTMPALVNTSELLGDIRCALEDPVVSFRLKGTFTKIGLNEVNIYVKLFRLPEGGDVGTPGDWIEEYDALLLNIPAGSQTDVPYDLADSLTLSNFVQGDLLYFYMWVDFGGIAAISNLEITQHVESFFKLESLILCEESTADVWLLYETIARICESITNKCMSIESDYYGRTDSEPDEYIADGCGALRVLTSGLFLRNAENPTFFLSMKELIDALQCIDNIGFGLSNEGGNEKMKIEPVVQFYQNFQMMDVRDADRIAKAVVASEIPGIIKNGYEKWEAERINGLDEFNSPREHRLTIKNAKTTVDIMCKFIAAGYVIETTRQNSFAETGAADTKYDNDTFIICMKRNVYGGIVVEQGGITAPDEMIDPDTVLNFRISPLRNMMRWAKSFFGNYRDHTDANSLIVLNSGAGNLRATGRIADDCSPENVIIGESANIEDGIFSRSSDAVPFLRPESIIFEYPMSLSDFKRIRANPYGFILHGCGESEAKGHIMKVSYKPNAGTASFELRNRYE